MTPAEVDKQRALEDAAALSRNAVMTLAKADDLFEALTRMNDVQAAKLRTQLRLALVTQMTQLRGISLHLTALAKGEATPVHTGQPGQAPTPEPAAVEEKH